MGVRALNENLLGLFQVGSGGIVGSRPIASSTKMNHSLEAEAGRGGGLLFLQRDGILCPRV